MNTLELEHRFEEIYGKRAEHTYFAPGRVNLIGEHTDYNGGLVFPCALSFGTYLLIAKREDRQNRFSSVNMDRSYTANAEENLFPSGMVGDSPRALEEERRLFYVAITRAEEHCYISFAKTRFRYGKMEFGWNKSRRHGPRPRKVKG